MSTNQLADMMARWERDERQRIAQIAHVRMMYLLTLGRLAERVHVRRAMPKPNQPRVSPLFYLPEVDPVTRRTTGGVETARLA